MKNLILLLFLGFHTAAHAQTGGSFATDLGLIYNTSAEHRFLALQHTVQGAFHLTPKQTFYGWLAYSTPGSFTNTFTAFARSSATVPLTQPYTVSGRLKARSISLGWKYYFAGAADAEYGLNLYSMTGFGLAFPVIRNTLKSSLDTAVYAPADFARIGRSRVNRLMLDLGAGVEYPAVMDIYFYGDVRVSLPTSNYPSPYLHNNQKAPLPVSLSAGIRLMFR